MLDDKNNKAYYNSLLMVFQHNGEDVSCKRSIQHANQSTDLRVNIAFEVLELANWRCKPKHQAQRTKSSMTLMQET